MLDIALHLAHHVSTGDCHRSKLDFACGSGEVMPNRTMSPAFCGGHGLGLLVHILQVTNWSGFGCNEDMWGNLHVLLHVHDLTDYPYDAWVVSFVHC